MLGYDIAVSDKEEAVINPADVKVSFGYIPNGKDIPVILSGSQDAGNFKYLKGRQMIAALDCKSCHSVDKESVGPAFLAIAERYAANAGVTKQLADKVIKGGSGDWGDRPMTPHPGLSDGDASAIVNYILSLSDKKEQLPLKGTLFLKEHIGKGGNGSYLLDVSYTDHGANGIEPLEDREHII